MAAKATRIDDVSSSLSYIGEATVGSGESDPVWRILRITIEGTQTKVRYAGGVTSWNNSWDDRASLTYV